MQRIYNILYKYNNAILNLYLAAGFESESVYSENGKQMNKPDPILFKIACVTTDICSG